ELFPGTLDMWILAALAVTIALLLCVPRRMRQPAPRALARLLTLIVVLLVAYLALPYSISRPMSWWYVAPRVPALMAPLVLLLPSIDLSGRRRPWLVAPFVAAGVLLPVVL